MKRNFHGFDPSCHLARYHFVFKMSNSRTPLSNERHQRALLAWKRVS